MQIEKNSTAIILAGGRSSRMGTEKGLVLFNGKPLIQYVIDAARNISANIIIITANKAYNALRFPCYEDLYPGKGPLSGICTGLTHSTTSKNLVLGCDMPFLSAVLLKNLIENAADCDALLTLHKEKEEPLCAVYDRTCIPHFQELIGRGQLKITDALTGLKTRLISFDNEPWFSGNEFANMNSPDDLLNSA